jgi:hypothetical protein
VTSAAATVFGGSLAAAAANPATYAQHLAAPNMLAATVLGYLIGVALPEEVTSIAHPLITCSVLANVGALMWSSVTRSGYFSALQAYITKARCFCLRWGPGHAVAFLASKAQRWASYQQSSS